MLLAEVRVRGVGPLDDLTFRFMDEGAARPRPLTILFGGAGVGKTSLLAAIACTRPAHTVVLPRRASESDDPPMAIADWILGDDDRARPHPLRLVTPNVLVPGEDEAVTLTRRREQVLFDRRTTEGGFVFVGFSGARWFAKTPIALSAPERSIGRYDPRAPTFFDDASRADIARETKQVLAYAAIGAALAGPTGAHRARAFDQALRDALATVLEPLGSTYLGADPASFEPMFESEGRGVRPFDELPHGLRHVIAFVALPVRALYAAYPEGDPRTGEAVVVLDDLEAHLDATTLRAVPRALVRALPRVQWIVTTSSPAVVAGAEEGAVLALRRLPSSRSVELFDGDLATLH